jgi:hypothetical protein
MTWDPAAVRSYTTNFPNGEFVNGLWRLGGTHGLDWTDPTTSSNTAFGTQSSGSSGFDDSVGHLLGYGPNHNVKGTVFNDGTLSGNTFEIELLLRSTITAHNANIYECNYAFDGGYHQIVRWPGALATSGGQFTLLVDQQPATFGTLQTGDIYEAQIVGNQITCWVTRSGTRTQISTVDITSQGGATFSTGNPGTGFWHGNNSRHYGFTNYIATELP